VIPGYETKREVRAQLAALEHERKGAQSAKHLEAIAEQEAIFRAELERMERTGEGEEPVTTNPAMGTARWVGRAGRGLIV
jgi:hypothetical protein